MELPQALMEQWTAIAGSAVYDFLMDNLGGMLAGPIGSNFLLVYLWRAARNVGSMVVYDRLAHLKYK